MNRMLGMVDSKLHKFIYLALFESKTFNFLSEGLLISNICWLDSALPKTVFFMHHEEVD